MAPALIASLAAEGRLPQLPDAVEAERAHAIPQPTVEQIAAVTWFGSFEGENVVGILGLADRFDHHRLRDALSIVHIGGSPRAIRELLLHAKTLGKPLIGEIALGNVKMGRALIRYGGRATRVVFEGME